MSEENKDTTPVLVGEDKENSLYGRVLKIAGVVVLSVSLALGSAWAIGGFEQYEEPTDAEKKANLVALLGDEEFAAEVFDSLPEDVQKEQLVNLLSDGEFDSNLTLAELQGTDLSFVGELVRTVKLTGYLQFNKEEVVEILSERYQNIKTFDDLPKVIKDGFNEQGMYVQDLRPEQESEVNGFLIKNSVAAPLLLYTNLLNMPPDWHDNIIIEVQVEMKPGPNSFAPTFHESALLFSGSFAEFLEGGNVNLETPGIVFFSLPDGFEADKVEEYPSYKVANSSEIKTSNLVVYGYSDYRASARVVSVSKDETYFTISGNFGLKDHGAPVFVLKDGKPFWLGIIVSAGFSEATVLRSGTVKIAATTS